MNSKILLCLFGIVISFACSPVEKKGKASDETISADSPGTGSPAIDSVILATLLPDWAKKIGLTEPQHMQQVKELSHVTSSEDPTEGFNSVTLVYAGNYDTAMNQATIIAKAAGLPLSKEYKELKKQATRAGHGNKIKGIAYMNYDLSTRDIDFLIYVKADEKGLLTISATDMKQMNKQLGKHAGIEKRKK